MPRLEVKVCGARNLPDVQTFGKIDPYCVVALENKTWKTSVCDNTENPEWNEIFKFNIADADSSQIHFRIFNENIASNDFLGEYRLSVSNLTRGEVDDRWVLIQNCKANAELHIRMRAVDFGDLPDDDRDETPDVPPPAERSWAPPPQAHPYNHNLQPWQAAPQYQQAAPPPPPPPQHPQPGGVYEISPLHAPETVLDCANQGQGNGTPVIIWTRNGGPNQHWLCNMRDSGFVAFTPMHNGGQAGLDVNAPGVPGGLWEVGDGNNHNQHWFVQLSDDRRGYLLKKRSDPSKTLDVGACKTDPGTEVTIWDVTGNDNQKFVFNRVG